MAKRILVVPDVHGRTFWKEPAKRYLDEVDKIVFLGDYLDPYRDEGNNFSSDEITENLLQIIELKWENGEKVVLLKGNHDQHYASELFMSIAGGTRMDYMNWINYNDIFNEYKNLFCIAHLETVGELPYVFTHAGLTPYWINKVNSRVWNLPEEEVRVDDPAIINRINDLENTSLGEEMLGTVGMRRSYMGEETGGVLWADIAEHYTEEAPKEYGLDRVFQVFGHTRLKGKADKVEFENLAMIDSQQCFMIEEGREERILTIREYEEGERGWFTV